MLMLARMVKLAATLVAGIIVLGILLHVLGANASSGVVKLVYDIDRPLVSPFDTLFNLRNAKVQIAVNWGIAAAARPADRAPGPRASTRPPPRGSGARARTA